MEVLELKLYNTVSIGNDESLYFHDKNFKIEFDGQLFRIEQRVLAKHLDRFKIVYTPVHNGLWWRTKTNLKKDWNSAPTKNVKRTSKKSTSRVKAPTGLSSQQTPIL